MKKTPPDNGSEHASRDNVISVFDRMSENASSSPVPELMRKLDADMKQVFGRVRPGDAARRLLAQSLVNCIDLRLQCKQAQWNIGGVYAERFVPLFALAAARIEQLADRLATRITALGGVADGTLDAIAEHSGLTVYPCPATRHGEHIEAVTAALAAIIESLLADLADGSTAEDSETDELLQDVASELDSMRAEIETAA